MENLINLTKEEILEKRLEVLDEEDKLWRENCASCTKLQEAIDKGILSNTTWKDRKNPICDACPVQPKITKIGEQLNQLIVAERIVRAKEKM